ncbi:hypothetical protein, partial [Oleiphilus sp. HI0117]|uniref:hypothetical protein n=1 Tax=Oleiphilus sp. HI0117 TaxID=1822261 RepID=UPI001E416346
FIASSPSQNTHYFRVNTELLFNCWYDIHFNGRTELALGASSNHVPDRTAARFFVDYVEKATLTRGGLILSRS